MALKKSNRNADLVAARQALKEFRRDVSILKKSGLIPKKYDARKVKPSPWLKGQIKKFNDVISGKAKTVKVSKSSKDYYKSRGYTTSKDRIVVPVRKNERVIGTHGNFKIVTQAKGGGSISRVDLQFSKNNVKKWEEQLLDMHVKLKKDEQLTFQLNGFNSYRSFKTIDQMLDYLKFYDIYEWATQPSANADMQQKFIEGVVLFKIKRDQEMVEIEQTIKKPPRKISSERRRAARIKRENKMSDEQYRMHLIKKAEAEKIRREKLKKTGGKKYTEYKEKARARVTKNRKKG